MVCKKLLDSKEIAAFAEMAVYDIDRSLTDQVNGLEDGNSSKCS